MTSGVFSTPTVNARLKRLRTQIAERNLDAIVIQTCMSSLYLTGFPCSNSLILITSEEAIFLTDFRYLQSAKSQIKSYAVEKLTQHANSELQILIKKLSLKRIGFDGRITYDQFVSLKKAARGSKLVESGVALRQMRMVKNAEEIEIIAENQKLNEKFYSWAIKRFTAGEREISIQRGIQMDLLQAGVSEAFETIAATGANSALPHAIPGSSRSRKGDYLLIDMGVKRSHYHSDMTRTTVIGGKASARHQEIYDVVLAAQEAALKEIRPGMPCAEVDAAARNLITQAGYGEAFGHGLGHGVGLEIHEGPTLGPRSAETLAEGMVVTVEPGIYIPGFGGVRLEDLVVVTRNGYRNFTGLPKKLKTVGVS